ncbi:MAG TPA: hypothetical protein VEI97_15530, partial [bacterium]|nr:hypothetical protein [bacterium]
MPSPITAVTGPLLDLELVPLPLPPAADGGQFRQLLADARERGTERPEPRSAADAPERRPAPEPVPRVWSPAADHTRPAHDAGPAAEPGSEAVQEDRDDATEGKVVNGADAVLADPGRTASTPTEAKPVVAAEGPATVPPAVQDLPGAGASPALPVIEGPDGPIDFAQLFPELVAPATPTEASDNLLLPTGSPMGPAVKQGPSADAGLVRQYRYGFGHGRPSLVTGPVNAKHLDRFGRDIFKLQ